MSWTTFSSTINTTIYSSLSNSKSGGIDDTQTHSNQLISPIFSIDIISRRHVKGNQWIDAQSLKTPPTKAIIFIEDDLGNTEINHEAKHYPHEFKKETSV